MTAACKVPAHVRDATNGTTPWHIWEHHVSMGVAALGLDLEAARSTYEQNRSRVQLWYSAGEPVWMAVDGMKQLIKGAIVARRSDGEVAALRAAVKAGCV
jgi:hypothetical protein